MRRCVADIGGGGGAGVISDRLGSSGKTNLSFRSRIKGAGSVAEGGGVVSSHTISSVHSPLSSSVFIGVKTSASVRGAGGRVEREEVLEYNKEEEEEEAGSKLEREEVRAKRPAAGVPASVSLLKGVRAVEGAVVVEGAEGAFAEDCTLPHKGRVSVVSVNTGT